jgi:hypothetical protein
MKKWVDSSPWFPREFGPKDDKIQGGFLIEVVAWDVSFPTSLTLLTLEFYNSRYR